MDDRYRPIYAAVYGLRTGGFNRNLELWRVPESDSQEWEASVRTAVEASEADPRTRPLRDDAKAFLAVNFEDLVLYPLTIAGEVDAAALRRDVDKDIRMLVSEASARVPPNSPEGVITARNVVDAVSNNWSRLAVARHGVWE
jgi:hypothetical protein